MRNYYIWKQMMNSLIGLKYITKYNFNLLMQEETSETHQAEQCALFQSQRGLRTCLMPLRYSQKQMTGVR